MPTILAAIGYSLLAILFVWLWQNRAKTIEGVPQNPGYPFFGNMFDAGKHINDVHDWFLVNHEKFKRSWYFSMPFTPPCIHIAPNEFNAQWILKDRFTNYEMSKRRIAIFEELFGEGIFASDGEVWKGQRKAASHLFTVNHLRSYMTEVMVEHGLKLTEKLTEVSEKKDGYIDIHDWFFRFTMESFCKIAFGEDIGCLKEGEPPAFSRAFDTSQAAMMFRLISPFWKIGRFFNVGNEAIIRSSIKVMNEFAARVIKQRRALLAGMASNELKGDEERKQDDLISCFLRMAKLNGEEFTDKQMRDVVINFIVAGRDTTACALSWFFYEMSLHPEIEAKVCEEIDSVLGSSDKPPDFNVAKEMVYTEACLLETLRLHPSVPGDEKEAVKADKLPDGTPVPAGAILVYAPYVFGRSEKLWKDAMKFDPGRWLNGPKASQYQFITFNAGPRLCLGQSLALLEAKLVIAMIMSKFLLRVKPGHEVTYKLSVTLVMKNGLLVHPEPRRK